MIRRTLIYAAAFLAAYSLLLAILGTRPWFSVQSHWQDNLVRFQEFAAVSPRPDYVIIGTSLVRGLDAKAIDPASYNLAAIGGNVLTGLEVVAHQPTLPRILFVEMSSMILQDGAEGITDNALRPVFAQLRPWVPMLRERYQPANLLGWAFGDRLLRGALDLGSVPLLSPHPGQAPRDEARFGEELNRAVAERQTLHEAMKLSSRCTGLKRRLDDLIRRGVRIVLLEMPHHPLVMATPRFRQVHDALTSTFPDTGYRWIRPASGHRYDTTDAIHLAAHELVAYQDAIAAEISRVR